jgi:hypothetical protein
MRARRPLGLVSILVLLTLWPAQASAGGWDALIIEGSHLVGAEISASRQFFAEPLEGSGPLDGRPYYAYLLPKEATEHGFGMIDPPTIPEGSILLGALQIDGPFANDDDQGYLYATATLSFTVPDVPTGDYAIGFCDDPCEHGTVGWLAWGSITIVHTKAEGGLLADIDRMEREASRMRYELSRDVRDATRDLEALRLELMEARADLRLERLNATTPSERIVAVPAAQPVQRPSGWPWAFALVAAGLAFGGGLALGARRRRRAGASIVVPHTVPDDLERLDRVPSGAAAGTSSVVSCRTGPPALPVGAAPRLAEPAADIGRRRELWRPERSTRSGTGRDR